MNMLRHVYPIVFVHKHHHIIVTIKSLISFLWKGFVCYSKLGNDDTDCRILHRLEAEGVNVRVVRNASLDYDSILIIA